MSSAPQRCSASKPGYDLRDARGQPMRQRQSTRGNPQQNDRCCAVVALHDLVGDAREGSGDIRLAHDGASHLATSFPASQDGP